MGNITFSSKINEWIQSTYIIQPKYIYFCHSSIKLSQSFHIVVCTFKFTLKRNQSIVMGFGFYFTEPIIISVVKFPIYFMI